MVRSSLGSKGNEEAVAEVRVSPPGAPEPISSTGLRASPGNRSVRLSWNRPSEDGGSAIIRYEYRNKEGRGEIGEWTPIPDSAVDEVNASGYTVGDLLDGTVFVFELRGVNAAGNGRESEPVEVTMPLVPTSWSNFRIERVSGENPFLAYGVVNDGGAPGERSGDGAYLPARQ